MIELRPATDDEMGAVGSLAGYAYGGWFGDGEDSIIATANRPEWSLCAFDGGRLVSTFVTIPFTMRANGAAMAMGGISAVATLPEYRRRGLMRQAMTRAIADMRERGQSVTSLWASQAAIYQRFGFSIGSYNRTYSIDSVDVGFSDGDGGAGRVELTRPAKVFDDLKALYIAFVADRLGYLHRSRQLWDGGALEEREVDGPVYIALSRNEGGEPNGYVAFTLRANRVDHRARAQELVVRDFVWPTLDAYRSLWSYLARHDLVGRLSWPTAPVDDPADELFAEPRMLHSQDTEGSWFRIVDVEPALAQRGYSGAGQATITVLDDDLGPWNAGTYTLETDGAETAVSRSGDASRSDVTLSIKTLSSLWMGLRSARQLRSWGLVDASDDAIERLDTMFSPHHAPHSPDHF